MGGCGRFVRVVVAGVVVAGLTACGGAGPPGQELAAATAQPVAEVEAATVTATPTVEPAVEPADTATPSAAPAPDPGGLPAAAGKHTAKGADAFVRYWVAAANAASASGDTELVRRLSGPSCLTCADRVAEVEKAYGSGGRVEGGLLEVREVEVLPKGRDRARRVIVDAWSSAQRDLDGEGLVLSKGGAGDLTFLFYLLWLDGRWLVAGIQGVEFTK